MKNPGSVVGIGIFFVIREIMGPIGTSCLQDDNAF